jgi:hypothetical protein
MRIDLGMLGAKNAKMPPFYRAYLTASIGDHFAPPF